MWNSTLGGTSSIRYVVQWDKPAPNILAKQRQCVVSYYQYAKHLSINAHKKIQPSKPKWFFYHNNDNPKNNNVYTVIARGLNQSMINKAQVFHDSLDNSWDKFRWANKAFFLAGQSRNTITTIEPDKNSSKQIKLIYKCGKGDGRVPIDSASPAFLIDNKAKQVFYFDERHDQLLSNQLVIKKILDLLDSSNLPS